MDHQPPPLLANSRSRLDNYRVQVLSDRLRFKSSQLQEHFGFLPCAVIFYVQVLGKMSTWGRACKNIVYARAGEFAECYSDSLFIVPNQFIAEIHAEVWQGSHHGHYGVWLTLSETSYEQKYISQRVLPLATLCEK